MDCQHWIATSNDFVCDLCALDAANERISKLEEACHKYSVEKIEAAKRHIKEIDTASARIRELLTTVDKLWWEREDLIANGVALRDLLEYATHKSWCRDRMSSRPDSCECEYRDALKRANKRE